jgi:Type II secretion system (T2SS), protein M subtype b
MMDGLSARGRRSMALCLLAAVMAILWLGLVAPILDYCRSTSDTRAENLRSLSRDRALLALEPSIHTALVAMDHSPHWARLYDSQKPEQAVLRLETDLRELLKAPNNPTSMSAQPPAAQGLLTRVRVKVALSMPIDQLVQTLARLSSHSKLLQIESLTIQAPDYQVVDANPNLSIQAEIAGFMVTPLKAGT